MALLESNIAIGNSLIGAIRFSSRDSGPCFIDEAVYWYMVRAGGGCDVIFPFKGIHDPNHRQIEDALQEFVTNPEETIKQVFQQADNEE